MIVIDFLKNNVIIEFMIKGLVYILLFYLIAAPILIIYGIKEMKRIYGEEKYLIQIKALIFLYLNTCLIEILLGNKSNEKFFKNKVIKVSNGFIFSSSNLFIYF